MYGLKKLNCNHSLKICIISISVFQTTDKSFMDSSTTDNLEDPEVSAVTVKASAETTVVEVHNNEGKLEANSEEELKPLLEEECPNEVVTTDQQKSPTVSLKGNLHKFTYFV